MRTRLLARIRREWGTPRVLKRDMDAIADFYRSQPAVPSLAAEASSPVILVGERLRDGEEIRLVRMRMPASTLHALGVTSIAARDVDVDVIVGEDGVARALRLNP